MALITRYALPLAVLAAQGILSGGVICFYGADLDQDKAKDTAKDLVMAAVGGGAKGSVGSDISAANIFNSMKTAAGSCYNAATGKFDCVDGVLLIYISAHGDATTDGKDTGIANMANPGPTTLSELTTSIAGAIPECCTVIFAIDACFTEAWYNNSIAAADGEVNPNNPFGALNWMVVTPSGAGRCFGTPVGSALKKAFGTERSVSELSEFLGSQEGVRTSWSSDEEHNRRFLLSPEPASVWLGLIGLAVILVLRSWLAPQRRRRS